MAAIADPRLLVVEIPAVLLLVMSYIGISRRSVGTRRLVKITMGGLASILCLHIAALMYLANWDPTTDPDYNFWAQPDMASRGSGVMRLLGLLEVELYRLGPAVNSAIWLLAGVSLIYLTAKMLTTE